MWGRGKDFLQKKFFHSSRPHLASFLGKNLARACVCTCVSECGPNLMHPHILTCATCGMGGCICGPWWVWIMHTCAHMTGSNAPMDSCMHMQNAWVWMCACGHMWAYIHGYMGGCAHAECMGSYSHVYPYVGQ